MLARHAAQPQVGEANPAWKGGVSLGSHSHYTRRFRARYPAKVRAGHLLRRAIRAGLVVRPSSCEACQKPCKPAGHHDDYRKPYDVRWLCQQCHNALHAAMRLERAKQPREVR